MSRRKRKQNAQQRAYQGTWRPMGLYSMGLDTKAKVKISEINSLTVAAVYRAVNLLASTYASLPFSVFRVQGVSKFEEPENPLVRLFERQPNPNMSSASFRETWMMHTLLWGNGYAEIVRDFSGQVSELYLVEPWRVTPKMENRRLYYEVQLGSDEFGKPIPPKNIFAPDMLHIPCMGFNGIIGRSVITFARESIGMALAADQFGSSFFGNGARPGGVLEHPASLGENAANRLRESWQSTYGGSENSGKVAILEEGMKYHPLTIPPEDAQFLETRRYQVEDIARWFGVPPQKLYDTSKSSYATLEQMDLAFYKETVRPWLVKIEKEIERKILPLNMRCEHNADELLRADTVTRYQSHSIAINNGFKSPNEVRGEENYNPAPDLDMYLIPQNMIPADKADELGGTAGNDLATGQSQDNVPMRSAIANVLRDAASRMVSVETNAIRRAAKNPSGLFAWADDFYGKHEKNMRRALSPAVEAYAVAFSDHRTPSQIIDHLVKSHIEESRRLITEAAECLPNELPNTVDQMVSRWETERVEDIVQITEVASK